MTKDEYISLFEELGFFCRNQAGTDLPVAEAYQTGRSLRHPGGMPTVYFGASVFTTRQSDYRKFPARYWVHVSDGSDPGYMNLKPRPGHEREAFEDLLD